MEAGSETGAGPAPTPWPEDVLAEGRLLATLERLLEIRAADPREAMDEASDLVGEALGADKVDAFILDPARQTLVARGSSVTPMSLEQRRLGLDVLALASGGRAVQVFRTGEPFLTGDSGADEEEVRGLAEGLGIRSTVAVPLEVGGERRGVLMAASAEPDFFTDQDLSFLHAVARWVGGVLVRAEAVEQLTRAAEEAGRRAAADELIAVLAHDLRNILSPLLARVQRLAHRAGREGREGDHHDARQMERTVRRLERLIEDLLDSERLEHGLFSLAPERTDLEELCRGVADALGTERAPVRLHSGGAVVVCCDPDRIRQAVENLVSNGQKHSPEGAPVTIELRRQLLGGNGVVLVEVRDQGPGVAPEVLPHLFTRFGRIQGSTGLGLGLYLASRIAEAHDGTLEVVPVAGPGALFRLALPGDDCPPGGHG